MKNQPHQKPKTNIMWRKYKGTTPEELCAANPGTVGGKPDIFGNRSIQIHNNEWGW